MKYFILLFAVSMSVSSFADAPLPPPKSYSFSSKDGGFNVEMNRKSNQTKVYKVRKKSRTLYWKMSGWFRVAFISNDGNELVACHDGMNLIPDDATLDEEMVRFFLKGKLVSTLKLRDLVSSLSELEKTVSHYNWGECIGFNEAGSFELNTLKEKFVFSFKNGIPSRSAN